MWPYRAWRWRHQLLDASNQTGLDINLIVAIMDRETLCGTAPGYFPQGAQGVGDGGHGRGLMQIDDRFHPAFCADIALWGDPFQNILYGSTLLRTGIRALNDTNKGICSYNAGVNRVRKSGAQTLNELDALTTGGNYVSDVLQRQLMFTKLSTS
jgi:soluble lytic murein transglycosylase-like protein